MDKAAAIDFTKFNHITNIEIERDISDTQEEINVYLQELGFSNKTRADRTRIYLLEGRIIQRETFIKKLNSILDSRK